MLVKCDTSDAHATWPCVAGDCYARRCDQGLPSGHMVLQLAGQLFGQFWSIGVQDDGSFQGTHCLDTFEKPVHRAAAGSGAFK